MPYIAMNEENQEVTASYCRDEYLRNDTEFQHFRCAFCEVRYHARNVYKDGKVGKAPHFYVRGETHRGDCDGTPIPTTPASPAPTPTKQVVKRDFRLPERLVARSRPRLVHIAFGGTEIPPGDEVIRKRRMDAGKEYGTATFTSSLLRTIVEGKNGLTSWCFSEATRLRLGEAQRAAFINETTERYPLQLLDQQALNYNSAFWAAAYHRKGESRRIFHSKGGKVHLLESGGFIIRSEAPERKTKPGSTGTILSAVEVRYSGEAVANGEQPRSHERALEELADVSKGGQVQWYAYGSMEMEDGNNVIVLQSLDHLYFR